MARLQRKPDLLPDAAEEMVRWVSPVKHFFRTAAADYELRGKTIRAGDSLLISYPSGSRDEEAFDRPFEFIPDRSPNRHLGYGFGIHACIGRHLAKAEVVAFFRELLSRVERIELAGHGKVRQNSRCVTVEYSDGTTVDLMPIARISGPDRAGHLFHYKHETGESRHKRVNPWALRNISMTVSSLIRPFMICSRAGGSWRRERS